MLGRKTWEYVTLEWIWQEAQIRVDRPGGDVHRAEGSYPQVVEALNELGREGWEVVGEAAAGNWILWTLKRER